MEAPPRRVLVAGVGAIGGWLLARFAQHGADVTGWARGATYDRLAAGEPLTLTSPDGDWSGPVRVVDTPDGDWDLVFVCVKSYDTAAVAARLPAGATVVSAQNGIENAAVLGRVHDRVVPSVVFCGCERIDVTKLCHEFGGHLILEDETVASWVEGHGVRVQRTDDVRAALWGKLLGNAVGNSLTAILRSRFGPINACRELRPVMLAGLREVATVARAEGVELGDDDVEGMLELMRGFSPDKTSSTLQDLEAGRPLEVDALTGVIVRLAAEHGIEVPTIRAFDGFLRVLSPQSAE